MWNMIIWPLVSSGETSLQELNTFYLDPDVFCIHIEINASTWDFPRVNAPLVTDGKDYSESN